MKDGLLFHLGFRLGDIKAGYAILPGDPGRVETIAAAMDHAEKLACNREFNSYIGYLENQQVVICSTGIGGPSAAIAMEELHMAGVHTVIRVGTCGAMQIPITAGDLIIPLSAVRQEGTSHQYAPPEYPATADYEVTEALKNAACELGLAAHTGVVQSKDSFYGQHEPERMPVKNELLEKWKSFKALGVLASEMETAAIFTVACALGMRAGCVLHVIWNQEREAAGLSNQAVLDTTAAVSCAVEAVRRLIKQ